MTILAANEPRCSESGGSVELVVTAKAKDLGGFMVRRVLPAPERRTVGPFIFFDEMGPAQFPPGEGMNVRPHPHIGLATVTFLFSGKIMHRDSLACEQPIEPGAVNLMTAGSGIVHSERTPPELLASGQFLHGIQTWMVLPDEEQEIEPAFAHFPADVLPRHDDDGVRSTVIIGEAFGLRSPVGVRLDTLYVEQHYHAGAVCRLPETAEQRGVYVVSGSLEIDGSRIEAGTLAVVGPGHVTARAGEPTHAMVLGGEPVSARHVKWNFVHSSKQRIDAAGRDWIAGRFATVPNDPEFIPLPDDFFA